MGLTLRLFARLTRGEKKYFSLCIDLIGANSQLMSLKNIFILASSLASTSSEEKQKEIKLRGKRAGKWITGKWIWNIFLMGC